MVTVTADHLVRICGGYLRAARAAEILPHLQAAAAEAEIDTPDRAAMWLAQLAHETGGFRYLEEIWGPTAAQLRYEPPSSLAARLGNTEPGDGYRYRGRGAIQLTGRANYAAAGADLDLPLLEQPDVGATLPVAFRTAAWYWRQHGLNALADAADLDGATRAINGGLNGIDHREELYDRACDALGV